MRARKSGRLKQTTSNMQTTMSTSSLLPVLEKSRASPPCHTDHLPYVPCSQSDDVTNLRRLPPFFRVVPSCCNNLLSFFCGWLRSIILPFAFECRTLSSFAVVTPMDCYLRLLPQALDVFVVRVPTTYTMSSCLLYTSDAADE